MLTCRWFDNTLFTIFRGKRCYDGGLTNFIPLPPTQHGVRVCCFPSKQITTIYDIGISPDNYEDWPHTLQEMLSWAFEPAEDKLLLEFIGELHAGFEGRVLKQWSLRHTCFLQQPCYMLSQLLANQITACLTSCWPQNATCMPISVLCVPALP